MTREECLKAAEKAVTGQREYDYGKPENNFGMIANLWMSYLGIPVDPIDVAMMMALLKVARVKTSTAPADDCFADLAGYAACGCEIAAEKERFKNGL